MEPRNRFQGMNSASLCSLAGRYDNPIPPRFLAHRDSGVENSVGNLSAAVGARNLVGIGCMGLSLIAGHLLKVLPTE